MLNKNFVLLIFIFCALLSGNMAWCTEEGLITGKVVDATNGEAIVQAPISAYSSSGTMIASTYTISGGLYAIAVPPGAYKLKVGDDRYTNIWYGNTSNYDSAAGITVAASTKIVNINFSLRMKGGISGTVRDSQTGLPIANAQISIYPFGNISTDDQGNIRNCRITDGSYTLFIELYGYVPQWYKGAASRTEATTISVTGPALTNIGDIVMVRKGSISGKVTDKITGLGIKGLVVYAYKDNSSTSSATGYTDDYGNYVIQALENGNYKLQIDARNSGYLSQWFDNTHDITSAKVVTVTAPVSTTGIDFTLARSGGISGTVFEYPSGLPLERVRITFTGTQKKNIYHAYTDVGGGYLINLPEDDTYSVRYVKYGYLDQWYSQKQFESEAQLITVKAPNFAYGINGILTTPGIVSGKVTDGLSGIPINGAIVELYDDKNNHRQTTASDINGIYKFSNLTGGKYKVKFSATGYMSLWYANGKDVVGATLVSVTPPYTTAVDGALARLGSISGKVADSVTGLGIQSYLTIYDCSTEKSLLIFSSDVNGNYVINNLIPGCYKINFDKYQYVNQWYNNKSDINSALEVTVASGNNTSGIDAVLVKKGGITGKVSDGASGSGLAGITVEVYDYATGKLTTTTTTDSSGLFLIAYLPDNRYKVKFSGKDYLSHYYIDANAQNATPVEVKAPALTQVNTFMVKGGSIAGKVTDAETGQGLPNITVTIYGESPDALSQVTRTGVDGTYVFASLPSGTYKLQFADYSVPRSDYISQWYQNSTDMTNATPIALAAPTAITGIDASLKKPGSISGIVTDSSTGNGIAGLFVVALDASTGNWVASSTTDVTGKYLLAPLKEGTYVVKFDGGGFSQSGYISQWYNGKNSMETAAKVAVIASRSTTGINAALVKGGSISGKVTESLAGANIYSVYVSAFDSRTGSWVNSTFTDSSGIYTISGLPTGDYNIHFSEYGQGYLDKWFNNKTDMTCSDTVHITQPEIKTGIDAVMVKGGSVSGTVTDHDTGEGLGYVVVYMQDTDSHRAYSTSTNPDGSYSLKGLQHGVYNVHFHRMGYTSLWYSLPTDADKPSKITITPSLDLTGINAAMIKGLNITGRVTEKSSGEALEGVSVSAFEQSGTSEGNYAYTDSTGEYTLSGLKTGTYAITFNKDGYIKEWYSSSRNRAEATPVAVTIVDTTGIDASLEKGGSISGTVTDSATGRGLRFAQVAAYDALTGMSADITTTNSLGTYTLNGLPSGTYNVRFDGRWSYIGGYIGSWYKDARTRMNATPLAVSAPNELTGIDATLVKGGSISGVIHLNSCPSPEMVQVKAHDPITGELVASAMVPVKYQTNFTIPGLPNGSYKVEFDTLDTGFIRQWYKDKSDMAKADIITLSNSEIITDTDALLLPGGGSISGTVTDKERRGITSIEVKVYNAFNKGLVGVSYTDQNGIYVLNGLKTGSYMVFFEGKDEFAGRWFNWKGKKKASIVTVKAPGSAIGINSILASASAMIYDDDDDDNDREQHNLHQEKRPEDDNSYRYKDNQ